MIGWRVLLWAVLVLGIILFLYQVQGILLPFVVSFIIAALLEPTVRRLRIRGFSRGLAVATVVGGFYIALIAMGLLFAPSVTRQVANLTAKVETLTAELAKTDATDNYFLRWNPVVQVQQKPATGLVDRMFEQYRPTLERFGLPSSRRAFMDQYVEKQRPRIAQAVQVAFNSFFGILTNVFSQIVNIVLVFILVPMFLSEMESFRRRSPRWIPPSIRDSALAMSSEIGEVFVKYMRGMATVLLLFTAAITLALIFLNVPYSILIGLLFGALYLIPYIGNIASAITLVCLVGFSDVRGNLLFSMSNAWTYGLVCMLVFLAIGWTFDHLIYPQMVGNSVGLSPVVSMFVILCGGALFGLPGMVVAFPLAGSVKVVLDRIIRVTSTSPDGLSLPSVPIRHRSA